MSAQTNNLLMSCIALLPSYAVLGSDAVGAAIRGMRCEAAWLFHSSRVRCVGL
jgi:hypothetical protein